ncbi:Oidioi.mRNA.OKI2018_I69.chr1.g3682.t1.cds [Oikopleura dioica]|uniref:Oidioi.mRNA.OKI2018_I69.chr1.g3682.t1.cds n=1 Tax=Oikopleura dioica TaxID=34765 RepID=A0ABN7SV00_OIKDI|nr:Oidioi.mRNA.OKI2018_I69.chr1.g3682.t1.cds [Oikopleura dioica]
MFLHLFTLYFTCQELAVHKSDLHFSDKSGDHSSEYSRLLHLHLADKDAILGSVMLRQLSINAIPSILKALLEFNLFQINEAREPPSIAGFTLSTRGVLYGELGCCFLLSPILGTVYELMAVIIGQVKAKYIIAMLVLFFLRQFYIVYCTYLLKKQTEDPQPESEKSDKAKSITSIWEEFKRD